MTPSLSEYTIRRLSFLLWTVCLGLAVCLAWTLVSSNSSDREDRSLGEISEQIRSDLEGLRNGLDDVRVRESRVGSRALITVATRLQPVRLQPSESSSESVATDVEEEDEGEVADGGPLAEDWEYAGGVFFARDPSRSRVWLRKKQDSRALRSRSRSRTRRSSRARRARSRRRLTRRRGKDETISFYAAQKVFKDEELELQFLIRSVDWEKLVYSLPKAPRNEYVLERAEDSPYAFTEEKRLAPFAEEEERPEPEEEETEENEEEDEKHFRIRARDYVDRVEEDYQRLLRDREPDPRPDLE